VVGDGSSDLRTLIERHSRRRAAATQGESRIPLDAETERCVRAAGHGLDSVLPAGSVLAVRKTANLHTGGTIHDVTDRLHPTLRSVAEQASRLLDIPVVGFDFMVPAVDAADYAVIEANERPGLANHEPQPTVERFVDLLFPQTRNGPADAEPSGSGVGVGVGAGDGTKDGDNDVDRAAPSAGAAKAAHMPDAADAAGPAEGRTP
jgi:hypothetical protein